MQLIITDAWLARTKAIHLTGVQLFMTFVLSSLLLLLTALLMYHWVFLKGAKEGWPVISTVVKWVIRDEFAQREIFMRQNLDLMAKQLGEMQAKLIRLESLGERVSGLAGVNPAGLRQPPGQGGLLVEGRALSQEQLQDMMNRINASVDGNDASLLLLESKLFEKKLKTLALPSQSPVSGGEIGSPFGWRIDPMTGRSALHTGLDFPAPTGTPILAAAGGLVVAQEFHPEYGLVLEVDHGKQLVTRYAHAHAVFVKKGDLVKRGQKIAEVGNTGRSTGAHLHFEVLLDGVHQNPQKFLDAPQPALLASRRH